MKELLEVLIVAYAGTNVVATIGYFPTIKDLWLHKKPSANTNSYILWTASSSITFLYSLFILPDLLFRIASGLSFISCALILFLSIILQYRKQN